MTNKITKAQLQAENEELKQMVEELQPKKKEFNYFNYFKFLVLKEYFTKQLKGEDTKELKFFVKNFDSQKSKYFIGNGIQTLDFKFTCNEFGQKGVEVTITNLDINAKAISKKGNKFFVFHKDIIGNAYDSARKALA